MGRLSALRPKTTLQRTSTFNPLRSTTSRWIFLSSPGSRFNLEQHCISSWAPSHHNGEAGTDQSLYNLDHAEKEHGCYPFDDRVATPGRLCWRASAGSAKSWNRR